jgi:hypothetical protein
MSRFAVKGFEGYAAAGDDVHRLINRTHAPSASDAFDPKAIGNGVPRAHLWDGIA